MSATASTIAYGTSEVGRILYFERDPQVNGEGKETVDGERYETERSEEAKNDGALGGRSSRRARKCPKKLRRTRRNYASEDCNASVKS